MSLCEIDALSLQHGVLKVLGFMRECPQKKVMVTHLFIVKNVVELSLMNLSSFAGQFK